jgi:SAM-dependent methyltransferase
VDSATAWTDPLLGVDWVEHWRTLVLRRQAAFGKSDPNHFDRIASSYAAAIANRDDLLLEVIDAFLGPDKTLIDVGAGTGRHVAPLAPRLRHVTAVEPAAGMRALIEPRANVTVVDALWLDAEVEPANLVISSHVLYTIAEPVPFVRKLVEKATERVFIYLRDAQPHRLSEHLWEHITGERAPRHPQLSDLYNLLRQIGIGPSITLARNNWSQLFPTLDAAVSSCRDRLGEKWDEPRCRAWLEGRLETHPDGGMVYRLDPTFVGVLHWTPE